MEKAGLTVLDRGSAGSPLAKAGMRQRKTHAPASKLTSEPCREHGEHAFDGAPLLGGQAWIGPEVADCTKQHAVLVHRVRRPLVRRVPALNEEPIALAGVKVERVRESNDLIAARVALVQLQERDEAGRYARSPRERSLGESSRTPMSAEELAKAIGVRSLRSLHQRLVDCIDFSTLDDTYLVSRLHTKCSQTEESEEGLPDMTPVTDSQAER